VNKNLKEKDSNEWYQFSDGMFTYYINTATREKKFKLEEGDIEVDAKLDDFIQI
jgi:hypothetical protein